MRKLKARIILWFVSLGRKVNQGLGDDPEEYHKNENDLHKASVKAKRMAKGFKVVR